MKVEEICARGVKSCTLDTSLADAGNILWEAGCSALPVVDEAGRVLGMVSDRDVAMALAVIARPATDVPVRVVFLQTPATCRASDDVRDALRTMRTRRAWRLPVVDGAGLLRGMLSFTDVALASKPDRLASAGDVTDEDVVLALKSIGAARRAAHAENPVSRPGALV